MMSPVERRRGVAVRIARAIPSALLIGCLPVLIACASAPRRENVCLGHEYVGVRNDTGEPVDIYIVRGGLSQMVATVGTGRSELPLPPDGDRNAAFRGRRTRDGRWLNTGHTRQNATGRLTIQVECDTPRP